jgi:hypothetical protein
MTPQPLQDVRRHIESANALRDPAERDRALAVVDRSLQDLLGLVGTYRADTRLQMEASPGSGDGTGNGNAAATQENPPDTEAPPANA